MFDFLKRKKKADTAGASKPLPSSSLKQSLLSLEQRLMFDAAAAATAAEVKSEQVAQDQAEAAISTEASHEATGAETGDSQDVLNALASYMPTESRTEVVFVDSTVPNYHELLAGMDPNTEVIMLDAGKDGVQQIADSLAGRTGVDAIHLISHGNAGELQLGTSHLTQESMTDRYATELAVIKGALSEQADLLIYGCNFAEGEQGERAATTLADLTGTDVEASVDLTGSAGKGGDWDLEFKVGKIETSLAIGQVAKENWADVLATYTVTNTNDSGAGSLRQAILDANATAGADVIAFEIKASLVNGSHTIHLESEMTHITDTVVIDGTTTAGFKDQGRPVIELDGTKAGAGADGLDLEKGSSGSTIRGLVINRFGQDAIDVDAGVSGLTIEQNYLGTDVTGLIDLGNNESGIDFDGSTGNLIQNNVIAGNTADGITMVNSDSNTIRANYIGVGADGTTALGNSGAGVSMSGGSTDNLIGGTGASAGNIIAHSQGRDGIELISSTDVSNRFLGNSIYGNAQLGIDLGADGVTANDAGDPDAGANHLKNFPVLTGATLTSPTEVTITGTYNSLNTVRTYRVEFFASTTADGSGYGEGQRYLGYTDITTNSSGNAAINATLTASVSAGESISATLTDPLLNVTSEFGLNVTAALPPNTAPTDLFLSASTIAENAVNGTIVGTVTGTDSNWSDTKTYSLTDTAGGRFAIDSSTGVITVANGSLLNYEAATSHSVTVRVMDSGGLTYDEAFTINLTNVNEAPSITSNGGGASASVSVAENSILVTTMVTRDSDAGQTLTYSIAGGADAAKFTINGSTGQLSFITAPNYEAPTDSGGNNVYDVTVQVSDGSLTDSQAISVTVTNANDAPVAADDRAGLTFDGVNDFVDMGSGAVYEVTDTVTMEAWINREPSSQATQIIINKEGEYEVGLDADGSLKWAFANTNPGWAWHDTGVVIPVNTWTHIAVTYDHGTVTSYVNGVAVETFAGSGTIGDAHPTKDSLRIGGRENNPANQYFNGQISEVQVWNTARTAGEVAGDLNGTLTGSETGLLGYWKFSESTGTTADNLTANSDGTLGGGVANQAPQWATYRVNEDMTLTASGSGVLGNDYDVDGDTLSAIMVTGPSHASAFTLNPDGSFSYTPSENFSGTDSFTYRVSDGTNLSNVATVHIQVDSVNDAPIRTIGTISNLTVSEDAGLASLGLGGVSYGPGGGADESGQTLTYAVTAIPSHSIGDVFLADGTTRVTVGSYTLADIQGMQFKPAANASGVTAFQFNVYDSGGTANGGADNISQFILITVNAVNDAPAITNLSSDSLSYHEGDGAVVIEQGANALVADVDSSNLDTGTLTVSIPSGGDSAEDVLSIRNQGTGAGQIGVSGSNITYGGVTIGTFTGGSNGSDLVITLNSSATPTRVTALVKNIAYENTDTNAPTTGARTVRYVLTDGDGGTSANYDTTVTVSGVNDAPTDLSLSANTVTENAASGTVVGTVTGTDVDAGDTKFYSLTDTAGGRFAINSSTGVITVADGSLLNYESATSHNVTVRVTDSGGLTYDEAFTINLTDVNETPTALALSATTVAENAANGTVVGTASTTDPDAGDTHTYQLTDTAGGRFAINASTGVITVADGSLLNYEAATSHSITVRTTDAGGMTHDQTFTIALTDVAESQPRQMPGSLVPIAPTSGPGNSGLLPPSTGVANEITGDGTRPPDDLRRSIEISAETSLSIEALSPERAPTRSAPIESLDGSLENAGAEQLLERSSSWSDESGRAQGQTGSASMRSSDGGQADAKELNQQSAQVDVAAMTDAALAVGMAGVVLQGGLLPKEKVTALSSRLRGHAPLPPASQGNEPDDTKSDGEESQPRDGSKSGESRPS